MAERFAFLSEQGVEACAVYFAALKFGPGICIRIFGVYRSNEIFRQTLLLLIFGERIEGRRGDDPAKIPDDCIDFF